MANKAERVNKQDDSLYGYMVDCPACKHPHLFVDGRWTFNGDLEKPTFKPSMLSNKDHSNPKVPRCHSFVTDGKIQFLGDCTHDMAGKTVDLPDIS